jgi:hypothetical protein
LPITLLLLSITFITTPLSEAQQTPTLSIIPSTTHLSSTQIGSIFDVNLTINNVQGLYGWNLNLTWNPKVLNLTNIDEGSFLSDIGQTFYTWAPSLSLQNRSNGFIQSVAAVMLGTEKKTASGSGILATITFEVLNSGVSPISIDGSQLAPALTTTLDVSQRIPATINNGVVIVDSQNNSPTSPSSAQIPAPTLIVPEFSALIILIVIVMVTAVCFLLRKKIFKRFTQSISSIFNI